MLVKLLWMIKMRIAKLHPKIVRFLNNEENLVNLCIILFLSPIPIIPYLLTLWTNFKYSTEKNPELISMSYLIFGNIVNALYLKLLGVF